MVNENHGNPHIAKNGMNHVDGRKVFADLYIDDKAVNPLAIKLFSAAVLGNYKRPLNFYSDYDIMNNVCLARGVFIKTTPVCANIRGFTSVVAISTFDQAIYRYGRK